MAKAKRKRRVRRRKARRRSSASTRSSRAIEVALAGLAHDIRTPLTGILALADLLQAANLPEREQRWAEALKGAADHLARLTTIVVDTTKAEVSGLVVRTESFSPFDLVNAVATSLAARVEAKGLRAEIDIPDDLPGRVSGDEVRLRSALENLIDNAVKFTERGSIRLSVSAVRAGRGRVRLNFTVQDSGIGIVSRDLKRLFRPFVQASAEVARRYGGAGLGLVLVKRIAEAMGGSLVVTSKPGRGSTFRMSVVVQNETSAVRQRAPMSGSSAGLRVLCVEDNPFGRVVLSAVLRELGHRVSFVGSGEAAIEAVVRNDNDVVLMDIALAGIDGIEATRRIRALPRPAGSIPIIGVSGRTEARDAAAAEAAGMNGYLRKPASPAELNEALKMAASLRRA
jgi:CheY-like chemotaxis protein/nitrogen-specific signal transduction histidine kinase